MREDFFFPQGWSPLAFREMKFQFSLICLVLFASGFVGCSDFEPYSEVQNELLSAENTVPKYQKVEFCVLKTPEIRAAGVIVKPLQVDHPTSGEIYVIVSTYDRESGMILEFISSDDSGDVYSVVVQEEGAKKNAVKVVYRGTGELVYQNEEFVMLIRPQAEKS